MVHLNLRNDDGSWVPVGKALMRVTAAIAEYEDRTGRKPLSVLLSGSAYRYLRRETNLVSVGVEYGKPSSLAGYPMKVKEELEHDGIIL